MATATLVTFPLTTIEVFSILQYYKSSPHLAVMKSDSRSSAANGGARVLYPVITISPESRSMSRIILRKFSEKYSRQRNVRSKEASRAPRNTGFLCSGLISNPTIIPSGLSVTHRVYGVRKRWIHVLDKWIQTLGSRSCYNFFKGVDGMNQKYTESEKSIIATRHKNGEPISDLVMNTGMPRSTIYAWIKEVVDRDSNNKSFSLKNYRILENKVARLQGIIEILKKVGCSVRDPLEVKLPALEALQDQYRVHMLCEALDVPRGTYYNCILRNNRAHTWYAKHREELRIEIRRIYDNSRQIFGASKICENGIRVSREMYYTSPRGDQQGQNQPCCRSNYTTICRNNTGDGER